MRLPIDTTGMDEETIRTYVSGDFSLSIGANGRLYYDPSSQPTYDNPLLTFHRKMRGWLAKVVDWCKDLTEDSSAATTLLAVGEVIADLRLLSGGDFVAKYKSPQIRIAVINRLINDLPSDMIGCPAPLTFEAPTNAATIPLTEFSPANLAKALNLDNDTAEIARAVHRVVRGMNDGECPKCHTLSNAGAVRNYNLTSRLGLKCPNCGFEISTEEIDAAITLFGPFMESSLAVFETWRAR